MYWVLIHAFTTKINPFLSATDRVFEEYSQNRVFENIDNYNKINKGKKTVEDRMNLETYFLFILFSNVAMTILLYFHVFIGSLFILLRYHIIKIENNKNEYRVIR